MGVMTEKKIASLDISIAQIICFIAAASLVIMTRQIFGLIYRAPNAYSPANVSSLLI